MLPVIESPTSQRANAIIARAQQLSNKWDASSQAAASSSHPAAPEPSPAVTRREDPLSGSDLFGPSTSEQDQVEAQSGSEMGKDTKEEGEEQAEEEEKETDYCVEDSQDERRGTRELDSQESEGYLSGLSPTSATVVKANFERMKSSVEALCNFSRGEPQPQNKMADHFQLYQSNMFHPGLSRYRHLAPRCHSNIPIVLLSAMPRYHKSNNYVFVAWPP